MSSMRRILYNDYVDELAPLCGKNVLLSTLLPESTIQRDWAARFDTWARPLSESEKEKCQNAERMIRDALSGHKDLSGLMYDVFTQGSYKANTNVRKDSDVDIRVCCSNSFYHNLSKDQAVSLGFKASSLSFSTYRDKIGNALDDHFTIERVNFGNKAFTITENTYRITADVVPTFEYRQYFWVGSKLDYRSGVCFLTRDGKFIVNWPTQTYENGVDKNKRTGGRYKKVVRVLKGLRNEMEAKGYTSAKKSRHFSFLA